MSMKALLCAASLLFVAMPSNAAELGDLQKDPEQARIFDYCAWSFEEDGKSETLPDFDAMLDRETKTLSTQEWAAIALVEAGTGIAQNAETQDACKSIFAAGHNSFDAQIKASLESHWDQAKYKKKRDKKIAAVQSELMKHWVEDQAARHVYIASKTEYKTGMEYLVRRLAATHTSLTDDRAAQYMKGLLDEYDWIDRKRFGKRISHAAWLLMQHADDHVELQALALSRMEPYLKNKGVDKGNYAYLWDRVAVNSRRKQRYGTQPTWECTPEGNLTLQPMEDPDNVNKRRKKMGLGSVEKSLAGMAKSVCG